MKRFLAEALVVMAIVAVIVVIGTPGRVIKVTKHNSFSLDAAMQAVVHISAHGYYGDWQGSGVHIGNGVILTAGHVVNEAESFVVTFEDGQIWYIESKPYKEPVADVGFLYIEGYDGPALNFDDDGYKRGDTVFIFGNPFGWEFRFSVTKGIVSSVNRDCEGFFGEKIMLQSDAASYPGNSGGPVVDDEGEIVGILVGGVGYADNISLIIPAPVCEQALKTYLSILEMSKIQ